MHQNIYDRPQKESSDGVYSITIHLRLLVVYLIHLDHSLSLVSSVLRVELEFDGWKIIKCFFLLLLEKLFDRQPKIFSRFV